MKYLSIILVLIFAFSLSAQTAADNIKLSKEEKQAQKEREKQAEREEKERLKRPAQIQINAPSASVSQLLIAAFQSWNYQLDDESANRLTMSKQVPGLGNKILAGMAVGNGGEARYRLQVSLASLSGQTNVTVNFSLVSQNAFGKTNYASLDKDKKLRREVDSLLLAVKNRAERETLAEQKSEKSDSTISSGNVGQNVNTTSDKIIIDITSEPIGAEIYIDDSFVGSTPSKIVVAPGEHSIKVVRSGYKNWERKVQIEAGSIPSFNAILEKAI